LILRYTIGYHSNDTAYASLIQELADASPCRTAIVQGGGAIAIYIDGKEDDIRSFFTMLGSSLPLCLYVAGSHAEEVSGFPAHAGRIEDVKKTMAMRPGFMSSIIDENDKNYLNPFSQDDRPKSIAIGETSYDAASAEFKNELQRIANDATNGKRIRMQDKVYAITPDGSKSVQAMLCINLNLIAPTLKLSNTAVFAMSAMQRPLVTVAVVDESEEAYYVKLGLPSEPLTLCLAKLLNDNGISALYEQSGTDADISLQTNGFDPKAQKLEVLVQNNEKLILSNELFDETLLPISTDAFAANFTHVGKSTFLAVKPGGVAREILHISGFANSFISDIEALDENGPKLLQNFQKKFPDLYSKLNNLSAMPDFEGFLSACASILGVKDFAELVLLSHKNKAPSGVKIDFTLEAIDGKPTLNLVKSLRTLLSYKLADVDNATLAYSVFESLSDFVTILCDEAKKGFEAKELVLCGGLFFAESLTSKVVSKARNLRVASAYIPQIFE